MPIRLCVALFTGFIASFYYYTLNDGLTLVDHLFGGPSSFYPMAKDRDLWTAVIMIVITLLAYSFLTQLYRIVAGGNPANGHDLDRAFCWALIPGGYWVGNLAVVGWVDDGGSPYLSNISLVHLTVFLAAAICLFSYIWHRVASRGYSVSLDHTLLLLLAVTLFGAAVPVGIAITYLRLTPNPGNYDYVTLANMLLYGGAISAAGIATFFLLSNPGRSFNWIRKFLLAEQICALTMLGSLLPRWWVNKTGETLDHISPINLSIIILLSIFLLFSLISSIISFRKKYDGKIITIISSYCFLPIILTYALSYKHAPFLSGDDYHFGENYTTFLSIYYKNALIFSDAIPPHGLHKLLPFFFSNLLNMDSIALIVLNRDTFAAIVLCISFIVLYKSFSPSVALLMGFLFTEEHFMQPTYIQLSFILLSVSLYFKLKNYLWIYTILSLSFFMVILDPVQNTAVLLALMPFFVWKIYTSIISNRNKFIFFSVIYIVALYFINKIYPIFNITKNLFYYLLEQTSINRDAYATFWARSWRTVITGSSSPGWELLRFSWIIAVPVLLIIAWGHYRQRSRPFSEDTLNNRIYLLVAIAVGATCVMAPYLLGRIDKIQLTRGGSASILLTTIVLPITLSGLFSRHKHLVLVACGVVIGMYARGFSVDRVADTVYPNVVPNKEAASFIPGLSNIGLGIMDPVQRQRIIALKEVLDRLLSTDETYLDLSNRSALYGYLGKPTPVAIVAAYNMVHPHDQYRAIERLERNPVPAVLLWADNIEHDGGTNSLRVPILYRWVLNHYIPVAQGQFVVGLSAERLQSMKNKDLDDYLMTSDLTDADWQYGIARREAKIQVVEEKTLSGLQAGDELYFDRSGWRTIKNIENNIVTLEDAVPLNPAQDSHKPILIRLMKTHPQERQLALWSGVFNNTDLKNLPWIWGSSLDRLGDMIEPASGSFSVETENMSIIAEEELGKWYRINAESTPVFHLLPSKPFSGTDIDFISFNVSCSNIQGTPNLSLKWKGMIGSIDIAVRNGEFLVPLDAFPSWRLQNEIPEIALTLTPEDGCSEIKFGKVKFWQRNPR